jgi:hypothetical protein
MRDGVVGVRFRPQLTGDEYTTLLALVARASTKEELRRDLYRAAVQWHKKLKFDTEIE